jgi:Transposase DDE domain
MSSASYAVMPSSVASTADHAGLAPKTYDGNVDVSDLAHCEQLDAGDADITLHSPVVNPPQLKRNLHMVVVLHLPTGR